MTDDELQQVRLPVTEFVRQVAREAAREVIDEHRQNCPFDDQVADVRDEFAELDERVVVLELTKAKAVGGFLILCFLVTLVGNLVARAF